MRASEDDQDNYWVVGRIKRETPKAVLLIVGREEHWIPKSQIFQKTDDLIPENGKTIGLLIPGWLAERDGIETSEDLPDSVRKETADKRGWPYD